MVTKSEAEDIRAALGRLAGAMPGYRKRAEQIEMIEAISQGLAAQGETRSVPVICAGTGVGKSVGSALPAVVIGRARGKKVVISTSTINLQSQLNDRDLPALAAAVAGGFSVAVAKGRGRYLCQARLDAANRLDKSVGSNVVPLPFTAEGKRHAEIGALAAALEQGWNGDRDALQEDVSDATWDAVTNDSHGCARNRCPAYGRCAYYAARAKVQKADVIVANHAVLLNAVQEGRTGLLPPLEECFVIVDEAHTLPGKAAGMAGSRLSVRECLRWLKSAPDRVEMAVHVLKLDAAVHRRVTRAASSMAECLTEMGRALRASWLGAPASLHRFKRGRLPKDLAAMMDNARVAAGEVRDALQECAAMVQGAQGTAEKIQSSVGELGPLIGRAVMARAALELMCADGEASAPVAKWVERTWTPKGNMDFTLNASPVSGAAMLQEKLWTRVGGAAVVSATLAPGGSFEPFVTEAGLSDMTTRTLDVKSPFDYAKRARLLVMPMRTDPRNHATHTREVTRVMPRLIRSRGTLVLFASRKQLEEVYEGLDEALRAIVLRQGALPKAELLRRHRQRIATGQKSVLFGLAAFAEGIDLPGEQCSHVIICKLPFSCVADPIEEAKAEWLEAQGRSAFDDMALPTVGIRLAQAAGRLMRTETDWGMVTVLDRRLGSTAWGRQLLAGLPPFAISIFPENADALLASLSSPCGGKEAEAA